MVKISEVMKKSVVTVDPELSVADVAKIMTNNRVGSVIVMDNAKPIDIITVDDVVESVARGINLKKTEIGKLKKKRSFVTVSPSDDVLRVSRKMVKSGYKRMPVVKNGKLMGIVSDKEILLMSPELINVLSEMLKIRVDVVAQPDQIISGICERCESYSDELRNIDGRWLCEDCL